MAPGKPSKIRRRYVIDLTPIREFPEFRALFIGELISETGSWVSTTLVYIQVYRLSGQSTLAVGAVGLVQLIPVLATALGLGVLADRYDRRTVLRYATALQCVASILLFLNVATDFNSLALVYCATALTAGAGGIAHSCRVAITPNLVPRALLPSAIALNQVMWNSALIIGPAIGGQLARLPLSWGFGIDTVSFVAAFIGIAKLQPRPPTAAPDGRRDGTLSGVRFVLADRVLVGSMGIDLIAMTFGMPRAVFPALAVQRFGGDDEVVGYLLAAISVGAFIGSMTSGWAREVLHQGRAVVFSVMVWGFSIAAFAVSGSALIPALVLLAIAGAADVVSAVFRGAILQRRIPEHLRGRIAGVHIAVVTGGPRLGDIEAGVVAAAWSPSGSVFSGGLACVFGAGLLAFAIPDFWRERTPAPD